MAHDASGEKSGEKSAESTGENSGESTLSRIKAERRDKAARLHKQGHNPYRNDIAPTHQCAALRATYEPTKPPPLAPGEKGAPGIVPIDGNVVRVAGRVMAKRGMGKTVFLPLRDGSGDLQLYLSADQTEKTDFEQVLAEVDTGDIVCGEGVMFWTKRGELSLLVKRFWLVTKSLLPMPDKWHGLTDVELRYRQRYLDMTVNPDVREVFRKRSKIVAGIRHFLDSRSFLEVETPMMHSIIGGAAARPFVTHHNALEMQLFMRIAPELYLKRLVVGGFERVYEIGRNFRNEGLSRQHNPEFTMLEFYQAYATFNDLMTLTENLVVELATSINGSLKTTWDGVEIDLSPPWRRLSVRDAVIGTGVSPKIFEDPMAAAEAAIAKKVPAEGILRACMEGLSPEASQELRPHELLAQFSKTSEQPAILQKVIARLSPEEARVRAGQVAFLIFEQCVESELTQPTFLTDFPLAISPLARKRDDDPAFCDRFELFVGGREIANGFSELNDPDDQRGRFLAQLRAKDVGAHETMDYDEDYCHALEMGMPPAAGEGIGIDRLTMLLTGQSSIRDVILFPLMRPE